MTETWAQAADRRAGRMEAGIRRGGAWRACAALTMMAGLAPSLRAAAAVESAPLRLGFSSQVLVDVNENDARAALKVWAQTMSAEHAIPVDPTVLIMSGEAAIKTALLTTAVDACTLSSGEFWALRSAVPVGPIVLGYFHGELTEEYLLLVHRDHPAVRLADLRGQNLAVLQSARTTLAQVWLETLLAEEKLGPAGTFWGKSSSASKLARIVLPVFFRQVDACVVTRDGLRTMSELNPQVGRQLRVLARSPAVVPSVYFYRGDLSPDRLKTLLAQLPRIADTASGRQMLALFQTEKLAERPVSDLDGTFALLDRHRKLLAEAAAQPPSVKAETQPNPGGKPP